MITEVSTSVEGYEVGYKVDETLVVVETDDRGETRGIGRSIGSRLRSSLS